MLDGRLQLIDYSDRYEIHLESSKISQYKKNKGEIFNEPLMNAIDSTMNIYISILNQ